MSTRLPPPSARPPSTSARRRPPTARAHVGRAGGPRSGLSRRSRRRLFLVLSGFAVAFGLITYRLVAIQGMSSAGIQQVTDAYVSSQVLPALRGSILASNGDELALSEMRPTVFADPLEVTQAAAPDRRSVADQRSFEAHLLAPVLHRPLRAIVAALAEHTTYVVLATDQSIATARAVRRLALPGVNWVGDPQRFHPDGALADGVIGGVNSTGGYSGLEHEYDKVLDGTPGHLVQQVDQQSQPIPGSITEDRAAVNGTDILTTLDEALQYQTEQALARAVTRARGTGGTAIVMNSRTGALLALASVESSPNGIVPAPSADAFTHVYEPGSVAKIITVSAALAQRAITPSMQFVVPYQYDVAGTQFRDAEQHPTEVLDPEGILAQSSNVGAIQIGQRLGARDLYSYDSSYGLTTPTAVHFPGESAGLVTPLSDFSGTTLATLAFGQDNAVTAAQMIAAVNAVAHGGVYVPLQLVSATVGADGREHPLSPGPTHRVIPAAVASQVTGMLEQVVSTGTGTTARINSYAVAGKTGTGLALKDSGGYDPGHYMSSFAGFAPAQDPAITTMVVVNDTPYFGSEAAAPAFRTITKDALLDLGIPTSGPQPAPAVAALPVVDGRPEVALLGQ